MFHFLNLKCYFLLLKRNLSTCLTHASYWLSRILIILIKNIRPLLGPARCRFTVTCTPFAIKELSSKSLFLAVLSIHRRLLLCSPFTPKKYIDQYNNL